MKEKIRIKNTGIKNNKKRNKRLIKKKSINRWVFLATDKKKINWNSKAYKFEKDLFYKKMKYWKYVSVKINHKSFRIGDTVEINTNNIGIILSIFRSNSQYFDNVNKDGYFRIQWFYRNLELKKLKNFRKGYFSFFRSKSLCNICLTNIQQKFIKWKYIFCNKNCEKCFFSVPKVFFSEDKNDYFSIKLLTRKVTILCSEKDYKNMLRKNKTYLCLKNIFEKNRLRINWKIFFYEDFKKLIKKEIKFSIIKKRVQLNNKDKIFAQASKCFQLSQIPKSLPCREKEFKKLKRKIKYSMLKKGLGTGFYISGMPGTGKTATIHWVLRYLEDMKKKTKNS